MKPLIQFLRIPSQTPAMKDMLVSSLGGAVSIAAIILISQWMLDEQTSVYIIPSMGATAVLLFALPHGPVSQPWSVMAGHLISAFMGVTAVMLISNIAIAAAIGVGGAILAMHLTRSIHPPGGATALAAVIGSAKLQGLGYWYILAPVLLNVIVLLIVAVIFNRFIAKKTYPKPND